MEFHSEKLRRIHESVRTDAARACIEQADHLLAQMNNFEDPLDAVKESRMWISSAMAFDKAAADGDVAQMRKDLDAKLGRAAAGERIAARRAAGNVLPIRGGS